ncbi:ER lumen protein-retaining receptor 3-like isoform X1 [Nasonia vitripennis]|uniref:ER lumen protein-retaining receptor n=1 Tax=Nasonia vitripennis TaxID=7425 RepID=A0A7M7R089_NASVI|nr:ER lumen protein-retaining receptor 3-like isoform X1 [Nasonia vitripennis]XP_032456320.1 ER lumen protein-retaining receptor 3-like isoform X1 [Nasonia vitripennis]XP_032456321.1 ER lumen protein-retaining receptor 3-like isoform X1 [Nasonia vitripennis]
MILKFTTMNLIMNTLLSIQLIGDYFLCMGQILLLQNIHRKNTCASVSVKTQIIFTIIFTIRYADLLVSYLTVYKSFENQHLDLAYIVVHNFVKIAHIIIMYWTLLVIFVLFRKSESRKFDAFRYEMLISACAIMAVLLNDKLETEDVMWTFSIYLEAVAMVPQRFLISRTKHVDGIVFYYIGFLSLYKFCYMANWIFSTIYLDSRFDKIAFAAGIIQLISYCDIFVSRKMSKSRISIQEDDYQFLHCSEGLKLNSEDSNSICNATAAFKNKNKITFQTV